MVSEITDCDFNPLLMQSIRRRRSKISRQSPDLMPAGQQRLDDGTTLLTGSTSDEEHNP